MGMPGHPGLMGEFDTPRATHLAEAFPPLSATPRDFPARLPIAGTGKKILARVQIGAASVQLSKLDVRYLRHGGICESGWFIQMRGDGKEDIVCGESVSRDGMDRPRSGLTHFQGSAA